MGFTTRASVCIGVCGFFLSLPLFYFILFYLFPFLCPLFFFGLENGSV